MEQYWRSPQWTLTQRAFAARGVAASDFTAQEPALAELASHQVWAWALQALASRLVWALVRRASVAQPTAAVQSTGLVGVDEVLLLTQSGRAKPSIKLRVLSAIH